MRGSAVVVCLVSFSLLVASAAAQSVPPPPPTSAPTTTAVDVPFARMTSEWMTTAGPALGMVVLHSAPGHRYLIQTVSWGKVLSEPKGPGWLKGRFEWAFEAMPVFKQFEPTKTFGVGASPLVWRWNFEPRGRTAVYAELAGGGLWTSEPVPDRTTTSNFTAHAGLAVRYFVTSSTAVVIGYRLHHISNGNRLEHNPGVNAHIVQVGLAYVRRSRD